MRDLVDFLRPPTGRCLGAVFSSYDFDEAFFESVLATLLPIHTDPDTDPDRFVDEGRRRLRETPVTVLIDGYRARGGHRLPFDLLTMPPQIAFHPKFALTLFDRHARLILGSANLTEGGYSGNAELMVQRQLDYKADAAVIEDLRACIVACGATGEAWERIQAQLDLLVAPTKKKSALMHSAASGSVLDQLFAIIPKKSKIVGVSLLLGLQPEDDPVAETAVLDQLLRKLGKRPPPLELGLPWEGNPVSSPAEQTAPDLAATVGLLCARFTGDPATISYVTPVRIDKTEVVCQSGERLDKATLETELSELRFWPLPELVGVGPVASIERLLEAVPTQFFVFPELRLEQGQVFRRALHAKLIAVRTLEGKTPQTHLLIGAPNFERFAEEANTVVEAAFYEVRKGHLMLQQLSTELVPAPVEQLYLQNRPLPAPTPLHRAPLEQATYDAHTRALTMTFTPGTKQVFVVYQSGDNELELVKGEPRLNVQVPEFPLDRHSAELRVDVGEESWLVPIAFVQLPQLLCDETSLRGASFWDFVDALSGSNEQSDDHKSPQHVFRAIATVVGEIASCGNALGAFEVAYRGPRGLIPFAECWLDDPNEAWLYSQELLRALERIRFTRDGAGRHKERIIKAFVTDLRGRLQAPATRTGKILERFYK